jgi:hypothetical protein
MLAVMRPAGAAAQLWGFSTQISNLCGDCVEWVKYQGDGKANVAKSKR